MKHLKKPSFSAVMPAYNEEASLGFVLKDILKNLPKYFKDYEIIVVDDGSTDKTPKILDSFARKDKHIKPVHKLNGGFNKAMIAGIKEAKKEYVACFPSNGKILTNDLKNCFRIMDKYDLVLGRRNNRYDHSNLYRLFLSFCASTLYRILFNIKYKDVHWIYIWKTKEIQKINLDPNGGVFLLAESLVKFKRKGLKIGQAITPYRKRLGGKSKSSSFKVVWKSLKSALHLWWQIVIGKI